MAYCASRSQTIRRSTVEVKIGAVGVGGTQPVRVQSMTTSNTLDVAATVDGACGVAGVAGLVGAAGHVENCANTAFVTLSGNVVGSNILNILFLNYF